MPDGWNDRERKRPHVKPLAPVVVMPVPVRPRFRLQLLTEQEARIFAAGEIASGHARKALIIGLVAAFTGIAEARALCAPGVIIGIGGRAIDAGRTGKRHRSQHQHCQS